ncbi:MAG: hypothetical protein ABIN61_00605 [candidate division WOR-3 bacterium]
MNEKSKEGISMVIILWIMAILTILTTATALMTKGDIASTLNLIKRKGALQLAENGAEYFIAMIPDVSLIDSVITSNDSMEVFPGDEKIGVHRVYMEGDTMRSFIIAPVPIVYSNERGNNPYGPVSSGGSGSYWVYEFTTGGLMGRPEAPQKVVEVAAGWWTPLGESSFGHTMY